MLTSLSGIEDALRKDDNIHITGTVRGTLMSFSNSCCIKKTPEYVLFLLAFVIFVFFVQNL